MDTHDVPAAKAVGKNRQWILDARSVGSLLPAVPTTRQPLILAISPGPQLNRIL
jgi:hypothetical protein